MAETPQLAQIKDELKELLISVANLHHLKPESISDSQPLFYEGLGLDSIDLLELAVHLDRKYGLKLHNDDSGRAALQNIENLARTVAGHLATAC